MAGTAGSATPIKLGKNPIFRLPGGVVARIARLGQQDAADRELREVLTRRTAAKAAP
ncbi:hypothetical protein [Nocardia sp. R6R-6]|uniref:hypothetical protein n=1 Tax=Nocardia sp. R6R-6 TaxID=3459303 RepID=UPI00403DD1B6